MENKGDSNRRPEDCICQSTSWCFYCRGSLWEQQYNWQQLGNSFHRIDTLHKQRRHKVVEEMLLITNLSLRYIPFCCHWSFNQLNSHISHKIGLLWSSILSFWFKISSLVLCVCITLDTCLLAYFLHVYMCIRQFDVNVDERLQTLIIRTTHVLSDATWSGDDNCFFF